MKRAAIDARRRRGALAAVVVAVPVTGDQRARILPVFVVDHGRCKEVLGRAMAQARRPRGLRGEHDGQHERKESFHLACVQ